MYFVATQDRPVDIATVAESAARLSGTTVELLHAFALAEIQIKYQNRTGIQWLQTQYTGSIDPPPYSPRGPSDLGESSRPPPSLSLSLSPRFGRLGALLATGPRFGRLGALLLATTSTSLSLSLPASVSAYRVCIFA